ADGPVRNYRDVMKGDAGKLARFNALLREQGIFKSPSKFYPSLALTDEDIAKTVDAIAYAAKKL
ncbi:MAG TPA: aspartate aminotransferase family protein, partial [Rhodospirillaceae bacterium]|nr:aspartate aminotransferase family protein [Rhodospirillaceae bacterium]